MKAHQGIAAAFVFVMFSASAAWAQTAEPQAVKPAPPPAQANQDARRFGPTLMIEVTVNRYQGEKRLSSIPYTLTVLPDQKISQLRVGGQVPVPTTTFTPGKEGAGTPNPLMSYSYRNIGTDIDVTAQPGGDGQYRIGVTLEESSVYPPSDKSDSSTMANVPSFRSLRSSNNLTLKNGQTVEFTAATDRISGEVTRISVKLTVLN
jgi:hypothetical protein